MIIDCQTRLNPDINGVNTDHFVAAEPVDGCFVLACQGQKNANKTLSDYIRSQNGKMFGFGAVNPTCDDISQQAVEQMREKFSFSGFVLYCCIDNFHPAHSRAMQFYQIAESLKFPVFFSLTQQLSAQGAFEFGRPYLLYEIARTFPNLKIIIGSMGRPYIDETIGLLAKQPNVYSVLTIHPDKLWQAYTTLMSAYEAGVMDKLLFGSDWPNAEAQVCIETLLGLGKIMADTNLPMAPREKIRSFIERDVIKLFDLQKINGNT